MTVLAVLFIVDPQKKADGKRLPLIIFVCIYFFAWDTWDNGTTPVLTGFQLSQPFFSLWDTWDRLTN